MISPRPRLSPAEAEQAARVLRAAAWSRIGDDWPAPELDALEMAWALAHGAKDAVTVSSGTAALTLALLALEAPPGDEVLIPAYGCPAVDAAVLGAGLTPIHVDVQADTGCLSPLAAAAAVGPRTAALIAVHFAGQPAGLAALARVAERAGLALIEDACLAPGAAYDDRPVGSWGRAGVFSLGVGKPITAGEGGLVVTSDAALAARVRRFRSLGEDPATGEIPCLTGNYRLSSLQAAVALPQLARLAGDVARREAVAARLSAALPPGGPLRPLSRDPRVTRHGQAQFWLRLMDGGVASRAAVVETLRSRSVPAYVPWAVPNYAQPCYLPARAAVWLRARDSGRDPTHYERTVCPAAAHYAFHEAIVLDADTLFALDAEVDRIAEALSRPLGDGPART